MSTWTEPATWYAQLPSFYSAAAALITDSAGKVLLVKPTYRPHWAFPGGYTEQDEYPHDACRREVEEELGVTVPIGPLLVLDWAPPASPRPRAIISFTFDCGTLADPTRLRLAAGELEDLAFLTPSDARGRLPDNVAPRVDVALAARRERRTIYLASGQPHLRSPDGAPLNDT